MISMGSIFNSLVKLSLLILLIMCEWFNYILYCFNLIFINLILVGDLVFMIF